MLLRVLLLALAFLPAGLALGDEEIETRREKRQREQMEHLLTTLLKTRAKEKADVFDSASSPNRCAEIEYYLRKVVKMRAEIDSMALLVEAHDPLLVPTRVYRVKYEDRKGETHMSDFLLQQHGAEWRVRAHLPPAALPTPATSETPAQQPPQ